MQSDTIIGIVGAVVLVAVMIGVFAYEYNNAPDEGTDDGLSEEARQMALFNATYESLVAEEDLDGDDVPNWEDDDLDGDGVTNQNDTELAFNMEIEGTVAQRTANNDPQETYDFPIATGYLGGTITVSWEVTSAPAGGAVDDLTISVSGPDDVTCDNSAEGESTCDLSGIVPGEYTLSIGHSQALAGEKDYTGLITVVY